MLEAVRRTLQRHHLLPPHAPVVVGVSGGTDSLALIWALADLRGTHKLHIATFDHGWRGTAGQQDAQYVASVAEHLGLPVTVGQASEPPPAANREAAARRTRYNFLAAVAREVGAGTVAVGHHADDQAETVLMHLLRGAGPNGLGGMRHRAPLPYHPDLTLVRPLLDITRAQIEAYCAANGLQPRHDDTNQNTDYLRNQIRLEILPTLSEINPALRTGLARLADIAATEADYLADQTAALLGEHAYQSDGRWHLQREPFRGWHTALQRKALFTLAQRLITGAEVGYVHLMGAVELGIEGAIGSVAMFPGAVRMRVSYDALVFEREDGPPSGPEIALTPGLTRPFPYDTPIQLGNGAFTLTGAGRGILLGTCYPPSGPLTLRTRRPGDRIAPPGMEGATRTLKKWMIDRKIPAEHRDQVPLLWAGDNLLAVLHITSGTVAHPYHQSGAGRPSRYALRWEPD